VVLDDPLADRQADSGTRVFVAGMQAFEYFKHLRVIFRRYSYAFIPHENYDCIALLPAADVNFRK
jgi:hypothetical protein